MTELPFHLNKGQKRVIRIKDFGANARIINTPSEDYLKSANNSLGKDDFLLRTDGNGFIVNSVLESVNEFPNYIFGDSVVESAYVQEGDRFCDVLAKKMLERRTPMNFLNGGYSGATSLILLNTIINKIGMLHSRGTIIFFLPGNDVLALHNKNGFWNFGSQRYSPILPINSDQAESCSIHENIHQLEKVLLCLVEFSRIFQIKLYLATTPYVREGYDGQPWHINRYARYPRRYPNLIEERSLANSSLRSIASSSNICVLDLERAFFDQHFFMMICILM